MNRNVVYSNIANMDLVSIHDYIAEHNRAAAVKVLKRIREACRSLGSKPFLGAACDVLSADLRFRVVGK
jgi:plasmid stabilization system protein ParE